MADAKTEKDLNKIISEMRKKYGTEAVNIGKDYHGSNVVRWPIQSPLISWVLGGGLPKGRIIEIYGPESAGKTSLACYLAGEIQRQGGTAAYIDAENAADLTYARTLGLNSDEVLFSQPESGEQALDIMYDLAVSKMVDVIVIDSVAALTPQAELDGEMGDQQMGLQARLVGKGMRKLSNVCGKNEVTLLFINQIREKIGVTYGNPETTPGGRALKFYASIRIDVRRAELIQKSQTDPPTGIITRVKSIKNKTAPPLRKGEVQIVFGQGFQYHKEYVDFGVEYDVIKKAASWYSLIDESGNEIEKIQGAEKVVEYCKEHDEYFQYLVNRVNVIMNPIEIEESKEPEKKPKNRSRKNESTEEELEINVEE